MIILGAALADILDLGDGYWQKKMAGIVREILAEAGDVAAVLHQNPRYETALREIRTELALAMREPLPEAVPGKTY